MIMTGDGAGIYITIVVVSRDNDPGGERPVITSHHMALHLHPQYHCYHSGYTEEKNTRREKTFIIQMINGMVTGHGAQIV